MYKLFRVEHKSGDGLFTAEDCHGYILNKLKCNQPIHSRHYEMDTAREDPLLRDVFERDSHYFAYKSINDLKSWIEPQWLAEILSKEFKVLELTVKDCYMGKDQAIFFKDDIVKSRDISDRFRTPVYSIKPKIRTVKANFA